MSERPPDLTAPDGPFAAGPNRGPGAASDAAPDTPPRAAAAEPRSRFRRILGAWTHEGAAGAWGLLVLGVALYLLAWPPGPLPWLVLAADAPFLWLLFRKDGRWKRWVFLYALLHYCAGFWWLSQITWVQVFLAAFFMTPIYLGAGVLIRWLVRRGLPWLLVVPTVLVFEEMTRTVYMGGMPLPMRSLALSTSGALTASTAYLGAYALSFLAALAATAVARLHWHRRRGTWSRAGLDGGVVLVVGTALFVLGSTRIGDRSPQLVSSAPRVLVAVQGDIPQSTKHSHDPDAANRMFQGHLALSTAALEDAIATGEQVAAVLWPETMVPWELVDAELAARFPEVWENEVRVVQNVRSCIPPMARTPRFLLGAIYQFRRGDERHLDLRAYGAHDSLFLVDPDRVPDPNGPYPPPPPLGERPTWEITRHDKHVLVPGGEYTPLGAWIPPLRWARNLVAVIPELDPGPADQEPMILFPDPARPILAGTIVCFEMLSPAPCRSRRAAGADVLLNPSNYGWFGQTAFRAQIRAVARLRAAETAAAIVVAGNTGPTLFYDPLGRPYGRFQPIEGEAAQPLESDANTYCRGYAVAPLLVDPEPTPYVRWGDMPWFGLGVVLLGFGAFSPRSRDAPVTEGGYLNTC